MECAQKGIGVPSKNCVHLQGREQTQGSEISPFCGGLCSKAIQRLARLLSLCLGSCNECWRLKSCRRAEELGWESVFPGTTQRTLLGPGTAGREESPSGSITGPVHVGSLDQSINPGTGYSPPSFLEHPAEIGIKQKINPVSA